MTFSDSKLSQSLRFILSLRLYSSFITLRPVSLQVLCQGQVVGAILAETQAQAQRAAKCVKIDYEELEPIITIKVLSMYEPHKEKSGLRL